MKRIQGIESKQIKMEKSGRQVEEKAAECYSELRKLIIDVD